jgi:hypothetical protein
MNSARPTGSTRTLAVLGAATALAVLAPRGSVAQGPTVTNPPRTIELGLDAGAVIGLGDQSSIALDVPAARARAGFFLSQNSRWSIEPAAGLSYVKVEESDGFLRYNLEGGALYHFSPPQQLAELAAANRVSVLYARPFVNLTGVTGDNGDSEVSLGGGLGVKIPWRQGLAWRLEANLGYGLDNEAARFGAFAGLSFFTRRAE